MSTHTPGPWTIKSVMPRKPEEFEPKVWITATDPEYGCIRLADVPDGDDAEQMANARLIAAAPRMLELIENLAIGWTHDEETKGWNAALVKRYRDDARAILRDVEG